MCWPGPQILDSAPFLTRENKPLHPNTRFGVLQENKPCRLITQNPETPRAMWPVPPRIAPMVIVDYFPRDSARALFNGFHKSTRARFETCLKTALALDHFFFFFAPSAPRPPPPVAPLPTERGLFLKVVMFLGFCT